MSAADDIAREQDQKILRQLRSSVLPSKGPIFPCPVCGKETKVHQDQDKRICSMPNCRTTIGTRRTANVTIELLATDGMVVAAVQFDQWTAVTPTEAVNAHHVVFNRMFPDDQHKCHAIRVYHDGVPLDVLLPQVLHVSPKDATGFKPGTIGMKFAPMEYAPTEVKTPPVQSALPDFQQGLETAQVERPETADSLQWQPTNEFAWDE